MTGCRLIENTIIDYPISIDGTMVNAGSWLCVIEVDNKELENLINEGIIKGLSLFSYANGKSRYMDVENKDDVYPLFISFVKYPANQVIFEVLDKDSYISKMEDVNLADEKSIIEKIKDLISSAEAEETPQEEVVDKAEEEIKDEQVTEEPIAEKPVEEEIVDKAEEEPAIKEETQEVAEEPQKEEIVEKDCGETESVVEKDEDMVTGVTNDDILSAIVDLKEAILQALVPEDSVEEEIIEDVTEEPEEPETYIIKQATQKTDIVDTQKVEKKQYFDILGRKIV